MLENGEAPLDDSQDMDPFIEEQIKCANPRRLTGGDLR